MMCSIISSPRLGTGMSQDLSTKVFPFPIMASNTIHDETLNKFRSLSTANALVEQCRYEWVPEKHRTIRLLSPQERLQKISANMSHGRLTSASQGDSGPLPAKEIVGVIERMPRSDVWTPQVRFELLGAAREFYSQATQ